MNRKLIIFPSLLAVSLLLISCSDVSKQKKWIYANIENKIWQEKTYVAVNAAYESLKENVSDYVDAQIQVCQSNWKNSDAIDERDMYRFFGTSVREFEYIFGSDSSQKKNAGRRKIINDYQEHCVDILNKLCEYYSVCLDSFRDSVCFVQDFYDSDEICSMFLGSPTSFSEPEPEQLYEVAELNVKATLQNLSRPQIASCQYDKEKQVWTVRIDNGDNQYVKFYKRDDGDFDIEYGNSLNIHSEPINID